MTASFLPTDGSTFPLISYGGSSYLVTFLALGIIFRIDYENRLLSNNFKVAGLQQTSFLQILKDLARLKFLRKSKPKQL